MFSDTAAQNLGPANRLSQGQCLLTAVWCRGLEISVKTLGPFYRIVCRDAQAPAASSRPPSSAERAAEEAAAGVGGRGRVLAVTSGFVVPAPLGLMHCDTLQVFTQGQRGEQGGRTRGGVLGLGLLMGAATFAYGRARGCRKAEILAINGEPGDESKTRLWQLQSIARLKHGCTARPVTSHAALPPCPPARHAQTTMPGTSAWCATTPASASAPCVSCAATRWGTCPTCWCGAARAPAWTPTWRACCGAGPRPSAATRPQPAQRWRVAQQQQQQQRSRRENDSMCKAVDFTSNRFEQDQGLQQQEKHRSIEQGKADNHPYSWTAAR